MDTVSPSICPLSNRSTLITPVPVSNFLTTGFERLATAGGAGGNTLALLGLITVFFTESADRVEALGKGTVAIPFCFLGRTDPPVFVTGFWGDLFTGEEVVDFLTGGVDFDLGAGARVGTELRPVLDGGLVFFFLVITGGVTTHSLKLRSSMAKSFPQPPGE